MCTEEKDAQRVRVAALSATNKVLCVPVAVVQASFENEVYRRSHRQYILHVLQHTQHGYASGSERGQTSLSIMVQYEKVG